jgi:ribosomal protein S18 acetylase RimI-like enzyme
LRDLGRERFESFVWDADDISGFVLIDDFVVHEADGDRLTDLEILEWTEAHLRSTGAETMETHVVEDDPLRSALEARGFSRSGTEFELMIDVDETTPGPELPAGYRFSSLEEVNDDAFIDMHRAAWSDTRPSPYRRELHDRMKQMPQFRADLVTIAVAPDGTPASYCVGWMDATSRTLEIEPLGTHRDFRRLGLARAVVQEVCRRAGQTGARSVLVWNDRSTNPSAYGLYTSAGMMPRRTLAEMRKVLQ